MKTASVRIILLDNQPLYVQGMADFLRLQPLVQAVTACTSYDGLIQQLKEHQPDIVFLELNLNNPRHDGFSICREIKERYKNVFVAVLSRYNAPHFVQHAQDCGAGAFFDKHTGPDLIGSFLDALVKGRIKDYYVRVSPFGRLPVNPFLSEGFELRYLLTKQECRVMKMIVGGKEHKEIEAELHISYDTFRTHHNNILTKLSVKNDVELTRFALENHMTDMDCEQLPSYTLHQENLGKAS